MALSLLYVKAALFMGLITVIAVAIFLKGRLGLDPVIMMWTIGVAAIGCVAGFVGVLLGHTGALKQMQVYVLWSLVYLVLVSGIKKKDIGYIAAILQWCTLFIACYGLLLFAVSASFIPGQQLLDSLSMGARHVAAIYDGFVEMDFPGLNSLPFLTPFLMALLSNALGRERPKRFDRSFAVWLQLTLILLVVIMSGRRALLVVVWVTPIIIFVLSAVLPANQRRDYWYGLGRLCAITIFLSAVILGPARDLFDSSPSALGQMFSQGFQFSSLQGAASDRAAQFFALIDGFGNHPFVGSGFGAYIPWVIRSPTTPWGYELFYVSLLFQVGAIIFLIYALAVLWLYMESFKVIRGGGEYAKTMIASMAGLSGVLIATATNPYLARFDGLWMIFVPIALINLNRLRERDGRMLLARRAAPMAVG